MLRCKITIRGDKVKQKLDAIIPVYKPGRKFLELLDMLSRQEYPIDRIIIINTEQKYFDRLVYGTNFYEKFPNVTVFHISKREFDHGATRHLAVMKSEAPFFLMMTQDAVPADLELTGRLMEAMQQENTAVAYARQLPAADCGEIERFIRNYNYPDKSCIKNRDSIKKLGIKTYFCSNVCALYRRKSYEEQGGFIRHTIFNEDMIMAAGMVKAGYAIAYCSQAKVVHSHNYTGKEQFHRNFDIGVSQADNPQVFGELKSESEGMKLVKATAAYLKKSGKGSKIFRLIYISGCKYIGFWLGRHYKGLPQKLTIRCSMNAGYWIGYQRRNDVCKIDASRGYGKSEDSGNEGSK